MLSFDSAPQNAEAPWAGMRRQLAPVDFVRVFAIDLTHPALVGCDIRIAACAVFLSAIDVNDRIVGQPASMTKNRRSGKRGGLAPRVFFGIIHLHVVDWPILRFSPDQINVPVV